MFNVQMEFVVIFFLLHNAFTDFHIYWSLDSIIKCCLAFFISLVSFVETHFIKGVIKESSISQISNRLLKLIFLWSYWSLMCVYFDVYVYFHVCLSAGFGGWLYGRSKICWCKHDSTSTICYSKVTSLVIVAT